MQVIELGEFPPPFGGVTVHVKRLVERLVADGHSIVLAGRDKQKSIPPGVSWIEWPTFPRLLNHFEFLRGLTAPFGCCVLHVHGNPVFYAPLAYLHICLGGTTLLTVHDQMVGRRLSRALPHERLCFRLLASSPQARWIAVSEPIKVFLMQHRVPSSRISVVPAYLTEACADTDGQLPRELDHFLACHKRCIVVYGYRRDFLDGRDLYGFDFALEVFARVRQLVPGAGLVLLCPQARQDQESWRDLQTRARELEIESEVCFAFLPLVKPLALWRQCEVMLRPTLTDGDSVAVREMLTVGGTVIASSVVPRPDSVLTLPLGNAQQWANATVRCFVEHPMSDRQNNYADGYEEVKRNLLLLDKQMSGAHG